MPAAIHSVQDFQDLFDQRLRMAFSSGVHLLYRGHEKNTYLNLPTICRLDLTDEEIILFEQKLLEKIKPSTNTDGFIGSVKLHPGLGMTGYFNDWLILTQARHLEMPSRLQDWSMTWKIALYFAVCNDLFHDEPGHMWILQSPMNFASSNNKRFDERLRDLFLHLSAGDEDMELLNNTNPFDFEKTTLIHYPHNSEMWDLQIGEKRRGAQGGKFIISKHSAINSPLDRQFVGQLMTKVEIPASAKHVILDELNQMNFQEATVLPPIPEDTKEILNEIKESAFDEIIKLRSNQ